MNTVTVILAASLYPFKDLPVAAVMLPILILMISAVAAWVALANEPYDMSSWYYRRSGRILLSTLTFFATLVVLCTLAALSIWLVEDSDDFVAVAWTFGAASVLLAGSLVLVRRSPIAARIYLVALLGAVIITLQYVYHLAIIGDTIWHIILMSFSVLQGICLAQLCRLAINAFRTELANLAIQHQQYVDAEAAKVRTARILHGSNRQNRYVYDAGPGWDD